LNFLNENFEFKNNKIKRKMSYEFRNDIISNSNSDIIEYLVQKLESRERNLSKYANFFNTIDSFETFYQKRKDILNLFKSLEEEIHQAALAIKALLMQNKALSKENVDTQVNQRDYNKLLRENNYLLIENNKYAKRLKELNNNNRSPYRAKSPSFNKVSKIKIENKDKNKNEPLKKINSGKKTNYTSYKNINRNKNLNNRNINGNKSNNQINNIEDIYNYDINIDNFNKLKNIKKIMKDMENNKAKLKEVINEHL
jgi:exonuclease VII small subunit